MNPNLDILVEKYKTRFYKLEKEKTFIDFVMDDLGRMCTMNYYPEIKKYKLEIICQKESAQDVRVQI